MARGLLVGPQQVGAPEVATIDERVLPLYTVLVPLHDESARLPGLVECLTALDYPRTRLEVLLLCEEDDPATARALEALALPDHLRVVVVPDSHPVTKAKACNVGLQLARGDLVVVYDAGDRPEPDQLKKAALAFARALRPTCVQATRHHGVSGPGGPGRLVPAWARSIRAVQSDLVLPALAEAGSPVLLGASAHHLPVATLRELGGWDPFDVTAEADLGARLARAGHRTVVLDTETSSAAPQRLGAWLTQCARTSKGLLLTGLVQLRHPGRLLAQVGVRSAASLVLSLAGVVALLLHPLLWAAVVWWAVTSPGPVPDALGVVALDRPGARQRRLRPRPARRRSAAR